MLAACSGGTAESRGVLETSLWPVLFVVCLSLPLVALGLFVWGSSDPTRGRAVRAALLMFLVDPCGSLVWLGYQLVHGLRACLHRHGVEVVELPVLANDDVGVVELGAEVVLRPLSLLVMRLWRQLLGHGGHALPWVQLMGSSVGTKAGRPQQCRFQGGEKGPSTLTSSPISTKVLTCNFSQILKATFILISIS